MTTVPPSGRESGLPPAGSRRVRLADAATWVTAAVIDGEFVNQRPALMSPQIDRAVAFVVGEPIQEVLHPLTEAKPTVEELLRYWDARYGMQQSRRLWNFFLERMLVNLH